jgi:hypothetical protein
MSDGLSDILEIEYGKVEQRKRSVDLSSLLEIVEKVYDAIEPEVMGEVDKKVTDTDSKEEKSISIALPFVQLSEAWGKPDSIQRQEIDKFVSQLGPAGASAIQTLRSRISQLENFTRTYLGGRLVSKKKKLPVSQVISNILLLDTLAAIVTAGDEEQYSASPAGFLFEGFLAALAGGTSSQIKPWESVSTEDITIKLGDEGGVPVSLKLLTRSGGVIHGSISDLVQAFGDQGVDLQQAYGLSEVLKPSPEATVADENIIGMKYIIVLKTAKKSGTKLDFYEYDFDLAKFQAFVEGGRIAEPGSGITQFKLSKGDYIVDSREIVPSFVLPSSSQIRLKAEEVLSALYTEFYEILSTLKTTTDALNTYLSDPEEQRAEGKVAATQAGKLEQEISHTTD